MSRRQLDYTGYRLTSIDPDIELTHPNPKDYAGTEFSNTAGDSLDIHMIPKSLEDWEYVVNQNMSEISDRFYQMAIRVSLLYEQAGIQDPEAVANPGLALANSAAGITVQPTTYVYQNPDGSGKIADPQDGDTAINGIAQLTSIIGRRSFTGDPNDGFDWQDDQDRDGYWLDEGTTATHNLDQIDQLIGPESTFTGFVDITGTGFWNAKDMRDGAGDPQFSISQNLELLNRSIGSREITNTTYISSFMAKELDAYVKSGYGDNEYNLTDFLTGLINSIGDKDSIHLNNPTVPTVAIENSGVPSSEDEQHPLQTSAESDTVVTLLGSLDGAIGNRVITDQGYNFILDGMSGDDVTSWVNALNEQIGSRVISNTTNSYPLRSETGKTVTEWVNSINEAIGNREYTGGYLISDQTTTASLSALETREDQLDTVLGIDTDALSLSGKFSVSAASAIFPAGEPAAPSLMDTLNSIGDNLLVSTDTGYTLTSTEISGGEPVVIAGVEQRSENGWFDNSNAATLRDVLQQIIDKIDERVGYGT